MYSAKAVRNVLKNSKKYSQEWVGGFRVNNENMQPKKLIKYKESFKRAKRSMSDVDLSDTRQVVNKNKYNLMGTKSGLSPLGSIAKLLMKSVLNAKNKTESKP